MILHYEKKHALLPVNSHIYNFYGCLSIESYPLLHFEIPWFAKSMGEYYGKI